MKNDPWRNLCLASLTVALIPSATSLSSPSREAPPQTDE
jgi:hypothetical protein